MPYISQGLQRGQAGDGNRRGFLKAQVFGLEGQGCFWSTGVFSETAESRFGEVAEYGIPRLKLADRCADSFHLPSDRRAEDGVPGLAQPAVDEANQKRRAPHQMPDAGIHGGGSNPDKNTVFRQDGFDPPASGSTHRGNRIPFEQWLSWCGPLAGGQWGWRLASFSSDGDGVDPGNKNLDLHCKLSLRRKFVNLKMNSCASILVQQQFAMIEEP
jgi:hypothetical protein